MPRTSKNVMNPTINMAGTFNTAPVLTQPSVNSRQMFTRAGRSHMVVRPEVKADGMVIPSS